MVTLGVVGVGHLGREHARLCAALDGVRLGAVYDIERQRGESVAARHGARCTDDLAELIAAVDAVVVAVPTSVHCEVAGAIIAAGKPVLVEKPLAATAAAGEALVRAAASGGVPLMVGHVERYNGAFRAVRAAIHSPRFIEAHRLSVFPGRGTDVDVIFDLMIHDLDLVLAVARAPVTDVRAVGVAVATGRTDIANARLEFADGMVANLTASRASREPVRKMRIFQDDSYISCDFRARRAEVLAKGDGAVALPGVPGYSYTEHRAPQAEPLEAELAAFAGALLRGEAVEPDGGAGVRALQLAERVAASMAAQAARMGVDVTGPAALGTSSGPAPAGGS